MSDIEKKPLETELTDEQTEDITGGGAVYNAGDNAENPEPIDNVGIFL